MLPAVSMSRLSRFIGIALTVVIFAALVAIGLRGGESKPGGPSGDLRNARAYIQDNLWSTGKNQYAVWTGPGDVPYLARRRRGSSKWRTVDLSKVEGNPLAAPTVDDQHNIFSLGVDDRGGVHIAGNMHNDPLRYVTSPDGDLGRLRASPAPPGREAITYPAFVRLPNGTLLFWRRRGEAGSGVTVLNVLPQGRAAGGRGPW